MDEKDKVGSFYPLFDMVLVEVLKEPEMSPGGIVLPDKARERPDEGIIRAIGPDVTAVEIGDHVIFGKYVGVYLTLTGLEGNLLIHQTDLLGRIKEEEEVKK